MRLLKKITDMEILNKEGITEAEPRFAARAVMVNDNNEIAVMFSICILCREAEFRMERTDGKL